MISSNFFQKAFSQASQKLCLDNHYTYQPLTTRAKDARKWDKENDATGDAVTVMEVINM